MTKNNDHIEDLKHAVSHLRSDNAELLAQLRALDDRVGVTEGKLNLRRPPPRNAAVLEATYYSFDRLGVEVTNNHLDDQVWIEFGGKKYPLLYGGRSLAFDSVVALMNHISAQTPDTNR